MKETERIRKEDHKTQLTHTHTHTHTPPVLRGQRCVASPHRETSLMCEGNVGVRCACARCWPCPRGRGTSGERRTRQERGLDKSIPAGRNPDSPLTASASDSSGSAQRSRQERAFFFHQSSTSRDQELIHNQKSRARCDEVGKNTPTQRIGLRRSPANAGASHLLLRAVRRCSLQAQRIYRGKRTRVEQRVGNV